MIEKFDLTLLIPMGGNMNNVDFERIQKLRWLINSDPEDLNLRLEQARFFASCDDNINTIISYCYIIKRFDNNLTAYVELSEYLYFANRNDWAIDVAIEGLKHNDSEKLKEILNNSVKSFIEMY